jgi:hypothetical protein
LPKPTLAKIEPLLHVEEKLPLGDRVKSDANLSLPEHLLVATMVEQVLPLPLVSPDEIHLASAPASEVYLPPAPENICFTFPVAFFTVYYVSLIISFNKFSLFELHISGVPNPLTMM